MEIHDKQAIDPCSLFMASERASKDIQAMVDPKLVDMLLWTIVGISRDQRWRDATQVPFLSLAHPDGSQSLA